MLFCKLILSFLSFYAVMDLDYIYWAGILDTGTSFLILTPDNEWNVKILQNRVIPAFIFLPHLIVNKKNSQPITFF